MTEPGTARHKSDFVPSRKAILRLLKQQGPTDAEALAAQLGISAMAVRQHLYALRTQKLVIYQEQPRPVGRPAKMWTLTPAAEPLFPDAHAGLTVNLLSSAEQTFGQDGVKRVLSQCVQQQIGTYRSRMQVGGSLQNRLKKLVSIRNEEGYMAEVHRQQDGSFLLIENHCAISAAAHVCSSLCDAELEVFRAILGQGVVIERTEHMRVGARRCVYRIRAAER
ncbi:MAG: transcriptional regulator [Verrucomicrobiales bacterium]|nr:transcriptional regulator [Verrucomicrobiales bacterium]